MPSTRDGPKLPRLRELAELSAVAVVATSLSGVLHDRAAAADVAVVHATEGLTVATVAATRAHDMLDKGSELEAAAAAWSTRVPGPTGELRVRHAKWTLKTATDAGIRLSEDEFAGSDKIAKNVAAVIAARFELVAATAALPAPPQPVS